MLERSEIASGADVAAAQKRINAPTSALVGIQAANVVIELMSKLIQRNVIVARKQFREPGMFDRISCVIQNHAMNTRPRFHDFYYQ